MKVFNLPEKILGLVFDIDLTLYDSREYGEAQIRLIIERAAEELHQDYLTTKQAIETWQRDYAGSHGQEKPSLGNTLLAFGIPIEQSIRWREELLKPEEYLSPDVKLQEVFKELAAHYKLSAVTNNPSLIGRRTLAVLGVESFFPVVIGLDIAGVSKPHKKPFLLAQQALNLPFNTLLSIGDRYEVDLAIPLTLGMGGLLVEGMADIYNLPVFLKTIL